MPEELIYLIIKRLTNSIDHEEELHLQRWIENSPENRRIFDEVSDIWLSSAQNSEREFNASEAFNKIKSRLGSPILQESKKKPLLINSLLRAAALALFLIGIGALSYYAGVSKNRPVTSDYTLIEAPMGSRSKVNLPDGTKVWLNGGSSLKFSNTFNKSDRSVTIRGEGYFDVKHNKELPFFVNTGEIRIKVLGTAFNIKAYPDEGLVETTLERGSLAIEKVGEEGGHLPQAILEPNQRATFIKKEGTVHLSDVDKKTNEETQAIIKKPVKEQLLISKKIDTQIFTSWKDNKLVFRNEPFESLIIKLERWYGVNIEIEDEEIKKYHFNGTFEKETIQDVLKIIHFALPIQYTVIHDQISIRLDKTTSKRM